MAEAKKVSKARAKIDKADEAKLDVVKDQTAEVIEKEAQEVVEQEKLEVKAKAGKRSAKGIKEAEVKQAKEERKAHVGEAEKADEKPKVAQKPARSRLERRSKGYRKASELVDSDKVYELKEALALAPKISSVKFDATAELHINLNVDPRQADQNIRGTVVLPAGTGKSIKIAVFADEEEAKKAKSAGAEIAAGDDFLKQLDKGVLGFDVLISTPANMAKLGKYARLLGPKGLMPNPKSGTVTNDIVKAVQEAKAGRVEYRVDSTAIIHVAVGKVSFKTEDLEKNAEAVIASVKSAKPASVKGIYIKSAYLTTTMGPSLKVTI